jgi:hypothetical protein
MAEVKYRYVRQLQFRHRITSWQPPAWNLTWWETFGPALVGNYATRTLIGRDSFCRSAANMSGHQLHEAIDSLMGFDVVMTLGRSNDIDLMISTLMGWPAQNFTSQPKARVRDVIAGQAGIQFGEASSFWSEGGGSWGGLRQSISSSSSSSASGSSIALPTQRTATFEPNQASSSSSSGGSTGKSAGSASSGKDIAGGGSRGAADQVSGSGSSSDYNDKSDDAYSDSHYEDSGGERPGSGNPEIGAYSERRDNGAYSDKKGGDSTDDGDVKAAASVMSDQQKSGSNNWFKPGWISSTSAEESSDAVEYEATSDEMFEKAAAELEEPFEEPPPPPAVPPEVLAISGAISLVKRSWQERWALQMGYPNVSAAFLALPDPNVEYTDRKDEYEGYVVRVATSNQTHNDTELWHAFPRHAFAFTASDLSRLQRLTALDGQLVQVADMLLDLDVVWIKFLLHNHHYKKKMKAAAATYTACGFAGMMPIEEPVQNHIFK